MQVRQQKTPKRHKTRTHLHTEGPQGQFHASASSKNATPQPPIALQQDAVLV